MQWDVSDINYILEGIVQLFLSIKRLSDFITDIHNDLTIFVRSIIMF